MMKYIFYVVTSQNGGEGQGNTQEYLGKDRHMNLIGHIGRPMVIETIHLIGLGFSLRRIQSEF